MSLLSFQGVSMRVARGRREVVVLQDASLDVAAGELVGVWSRNSLERRAFAQLAAGLRRPDAGVVRYAGHDIRPDCDGPWLQGIAYVPQTSDPPIVPLVRDHVALPGQGQSTRTRQKRAHALLERVGAADCAQLTIDELDPFELVLVNIARALMASPRVLVLEGPTTDLESIERNDVRQLLRSIVADGLAVVVSTSEITDVFRATRLLALAGGSLISSHDSGTVVPDIRERERQRLRSA